MDVVLLGVKAWQVPQAGEAMRPMVGAGTFVVPLQNGVEAPDQLAAALGAEHVLAGMCRISALVAAPGFIRHVGIEPYVAFGELDNRPSQRGERLKSAFERAGVWAEVPADIQSALWQKFTFIASVSGVGAVTRAPTGLVRSQPGTRSMLEQAIQEIEAVARARQVSLPGDILARTMATIDGMPEGVVPSMQRDIVEGRPSELEAQNGAVVRMGLEAGVPTPLHAFLYHSLYLQEKRARREAAF
jgi:2-dehydropantoate 2-reductase